jgi:hypothetical protein
LPRGADLHHHRRRPGHGVSPPGHVTRLESPS